MKAKALKTFSGQHGRFRRGEEFTAPEPYIQFLVRNGMAVPMHSAKTEVANKAPERPSTERRSGGDTGAEKQSSSSQEAPARKTRRSRKSKAAAK